MDQLQYSRLMALVAGVPDPRKARGKQLEWPFIWGVIVTAMLSQQRSARQSLIGRNDKLPP